MVSYSRASSPVGLRSVHTRWQVAATCRNHRAHQQIASCILEYFCENLCSATEFCRSNMLQKIKSDRICVTCHGNKILLQRQIFSQKFSSTHKVICLHDVSPQHVAATSRQTCTDGVICRHNLLPSVYWPLSLGAVFSFTKILLYSFWKECACNELLCLY